MNILQFFSEVLHSNCCIWVCTLIVAGAAIIIVDKILKYLKSKFEKQTQIECHMLNCKDIKDVKEQLSKIADMMEKISISVEQIKTDVEVRKNTEEKSKKPNQLDT